MKDIGKRKIGIMGGTFDPIHYGHLLIAQSAADEFQLEQVVFIPTGRTPHKADIEVTDGEQRCIMVQKAIADNRNFHLSKLEIKNEEISYTYRTLEKLTREYNDTHFYFIMGEDSLMDFESWRLPDKICELATILVALRDDTDGVRLFDQLELIKEKYQADIYPLHSPNYSVSSRDIRERLRNGQSIRYLVPESVGAYIARENLYLKGTFHYD